MASIKKIETDNRKYYIDYITFSQLTNQLISYIVFALAV